MTYYIVKVELSSKIKKKTYEGVEHDPAHQGIVGEAHADDALPHVSALEHLGHR